MQRFQAIDDEITAPVSEDLFLYCASLFQASASMSVPMIGVPLGISSDEPRLNNSPIAFGLAAVTNELRQQQVSEVVVMAIGLRLIHIGDVFSAADRFPKWIRRSTLNPEDYEISESLILACASAKITMSESRMTFDFDDIERHAQAIDDRGEAIPSSPPDLQFALANQRRAVGYLH